MRILFLDDDLTRTKTFLQDIPSALTAETAQEAIALLESNEFDFAFLDHDLGERVYVNSDDPNTGMEVVRWMELHQPLVKAVIVHTYNPPAGKEMTARLSDMGYECVYFPFNNAEFKYAVQQIAKSIEFGASKK